MNLLDDVPDYKKPSTISLINQATKLVGRRKTRRGKKKRKIKSNEWKKQFDIAMKQHKQMKKERAQEFQNFHRLIEKE